ncbi:MAG TPA: ADP-ribosylglycohydrolase family protein [Planctomycetota bacterium]|nr:ADP-ribosylglycohydrolase family protein [Planctomycetota bacterium]
MDTLSKQRCSRALLSLDGLSVGDAFGQTFFCSDDDIEKRLKERSLPPPHWSYTDDTLMSLSVVSSLLKFGKIEQDWLAASFAERYDWRRGYGPAMHRMLLELQEGKYWKDIAGKQFDGEGSYGNGAGMRSAPIGAYFADDLEKVAQQAELAAVVTHSHPEAVAGAVAVAIAAAMATRSYVEGNLPEPSNFLATIEDYVPRSQVRKGLFQAQTLDPDASVQSAVSALGNGHDLSAMDTVPFALWCASRNLWNYELALWETVSGLGDRDTTCAIVGGIAALSSESGVPAEWRKLREGLPQWYVEGVDVEELKAVELIKGDKGKKGKKPEIDLYVGD